MLAMLLQKKRPRRGRHCEVEPPQDPQLQPLLEGVEVIISLSMTSRMPKANMRSDGRYAFPEIFVQHGRL